MWAQIHPMPIISVGAAQGPDPGKARARGRQPPLRLYRAVPIVFLTFLLNLNLISEMKPISNIVH